MLTVAAIRRPLRTIVATANAARTRSAAMAASAAVLGRSATNSSPPRRPMMSVARNVSRDLGEVLQHCIAGRVPASVVDGLEVVEVENEHADGRHAIATADRDEAAGGFKES